MTEEKDATSAPDGAKRAASAKGWSTWTLEKKLSIVIVPILVAVIGGAISLLSIVLDDDPTSSPNTTPPSAAPGPDKREVPRFSGVVGNFERARALLTFLDDNDGDSVQLEEVAFNEATIDDFIGDPGSVTYVQVWTECTPPVGEGVDPDFRLGCKAASFEIRGAETEDTQTYLQHGVPVYDGFFRVDVSGNLQMGVTPTFLEPLTRQEAATG